MSVLLIQNTLVIPVSEKQRSSFFQADIVIDGGLIKEVGPNLRDKYKDCEIIKGEGKLALPGFINCHTHAAMTLLRSYADDLPLMEWLSQKIWPREAHLSEGDIYWGTMLAILEMIKSGTTTFADMYFFMSQVARAVEETGIRASLSRGMVGVGDNAQLAVKESRDFITEWHQKAEGRITCLLGPHAPYTCPPDYLKTVMELGDELEVGMHIHLAETKTEVQDMLKQYGKTPVMLLDELNFFTGRRVIAAHCVHLTPEERKILVYRGVGIAHNPESNMKLASGIAPIPELLQEGAVVGLGTDGASSNNNLDMLEEMRTCALLHKAASLDPTVMQAYQTLEMATKEGARVLGFGDLGSIEEGKKADIIMIDLDKPHLTPLHDPIASLVYAAQSSDVVHSIINGKLVMKDREMLTIDEEKVLFEAGRVGRELVMR